MKIIILLQVVAVVVGVVVDRFKWVLNLMFRMIIIILVIYLRMIFQDVGDVVVVVVIILINL
jgi:hypothetical protein